MDRKAIRVGNWLRGHSSLSRSYYQHIDLFCVCCNSPIGRCYIERPSGGGSERTWVFMFQGRIEAIGMAASAGEAKRCVADTVTDWAKKHSWRLVG